MDKIIKSVDRIGKDYLDKSFSFHRGTNKFVAKSADMSKAVNSRKIEAEQVNVIKFFDDIWLYIEIKYLPRTDKKKKVPNIFFSLSVFQGDSYDDKKIQLFRAEWDNYDEPSDKHPQPHWHIYTKKEERKKDFKDEIEESSSFETFLEDKNTLNINKFHFAMNAQWSEKKPDVHSVLVENDLINWFEGLLNHLKQELEYVKKKK